MTAATVITLGYGSFGTVNFVPTLGYGAFGDAPTEPPTEAPTQPPIVGKPRKTIPSRKHRWAVWTDEGYRYFDTAKEAYAFLYPEEPAQVEPKKRIPRARMLGPSLQPRVTYAGEDIAAVTVRGMAGDEAFDLGDRILARALQKRIEQEIDRRERHAQKEQERQRLQAAAERQEFERLSAIARERARQDDETIALLLLAA